MGYRKDSAKRLKFKTWLHNSRDNLISYGIPSDIFEHEARWWYLLEHGYDYESEWNPTFLSSPNQEKLLEFLRSEYKNGEARCLITDIEKNMDSSG